MTAHHARFPAVLRICFPLIAIVALSACGGEGRASTPRTPLLANIGQVVRWQRTLRLEENASVINVSPSVAVLPSGTFLVSDRKEQQLRFYAPDGHLLHTAGRRGSGPGEFQHLARGVRLHDGTILAADMFGGLTEFDSTGTRVLRTAQSGIGPVYELVVRDDSTVTIVGRKGARMDGALVHDWNVRSRSVTRSFYPAPQGPPGYAAAYAFTGFADAAVRGDTMAVLFALSDSIHLFLRDGREIGTVPVPYGAFRKMPKPLAPQTPFEQLQGWIDSFSAATDLFWLADGSFLVQYLDQKGSDRIYSLLHLQRDGSARWEVPGAPHLLTVTSDGSLVFVKPGAEAPNEWSIARLASGR